MILKVLERGKINYTVPVLTLDVIQVALKEPRKHPLAMGGLAKLEWNYFETPKLELCVTPETDFEITKGMSVNSLGARAYERFQKCQLFKSRPAGLTLSLTAYEADELWGGIRKILWSSVDDDQLTSNQRADVSQLFFHTIAGSTMSNAAFLTIDRNFHEHQSEIERELGVSVLTPTEAWDRYHSAYGLYQPTDAEIMALWNDQNRYLAQLHTEANAMATIL